MYNYKRLKRQSTKVTKKYNDIDVLYNYKKFKKQANTKLNALLNDLNKAQEGNFYISEDKIVGKFPSGTIPDELMIILDKHNADWDWYTEVEPHIWIDEDTGPQYQF